MLTEDEKSLIRYAIIEEIKRIDGVIEIIERSDGDASAYESLITENKQLLDKVRSL